MSIFYTKVDAYATRQPKRTVSKKPLVQSPVVSLRAGANDWSNIPSGGTGVGNAKIRNNERYEDPELIERERKAQEEIAYKKTCVAPAYNKGGYQYITEGTDLKTLGRKV